MFKNGIIPSNGENNDAELLLVCKKCGFKYWYFGSAKPEIDLRCCGCERIEIPRKIKRNPRIINRTNPDPYKRRQI